MTIFHITLILIMTASSYAGTKIGRPLSNRNAEWSKRIDDFAGGRIVGGRKAYDGEFPYQVSIRNPYSHACGGSIIDEEHILTAAHCLYDLYGNLLSVINFRILAGTNHQYNLDYTVQVRKLTEYFIHEEYDHNLWAHDIALLRMDSPLVFNTTVKSIGLAKSDPKPGTQCTLSGWGFLFAGSEVIPDDLYTVNMTSISLSNCKTLYKAIGYPDRIQDDMLCCLENGKDSCDGDSGGPVVCDNVLNGIVSFSEGCARPNIPDVYANVAFYRDWIYAKISS